MSDIEYHCEDCGISIDAQSTNPEKPLRLNCIDCGSKMHSSVSDGDIPKQGRNKFEIFMMFMMGAYALLILTVFVYFVTGGTI